LTNDIFDHLSRVRPGANGEIQLTDALAAQAHSSASIALVTSIARRDIGYPLGWMQAVVESALRDPHAGPQVRRILNELLQSSIDD
jgi:UTP--glucose-1-phosphate uridylyltransferase